MATVSTTTIGSLYRFKEDLNESIDEAIAFQRKLGMDLISDGEQRTDMVSYFAESLSGLSVVQGVPVITGKVESVGDPDEFAKVKDLAYIRERHPDLAVKVAITGPTTLGMTCGSRGVGPHYRNLNDFRLYEDIAGALAPIARALAHMGAYVQIDEPFLSQGYKDLGERVGLLDQIVADVPVDRASVHVCGDITRFGVLDHLLALDGVSTLSFAFAGKHERPNSEVLRSTLLAESDKKLGVGCIAVTPTSEAEVNTPEAVSDILRKTVDTIGIDSVAYAHPDCGLRVTGKSLVPIILRNLRAGVDLLG